MPTWAELPKLYNGFAVTDPRGLAPKGWHISTDEEWNNLAGSLGGKEAATLKLKSKTLWTKGAEDINESDFNSLSVGKSPLTAMPKIIHSSGFGGATPPTKRC